MGLIGLHIFVRGFSTPPRGEAVGVGYASWRCTKNCRVLIPCEIRPLALLAPEPTVDAPIEVEFGGETDVKRARMVPGGHCERFDHDKFLLGHAGTEEELEIMDDLDREEPDITEEAGPSFPFYAKMSGAR